MPIAHRHEDTRIEDFPELPLERRRLPLREFAQRGLPSYAGIVLTDLCRSARSDQPRHGRACQPRKREINNVRVREEVIEKGLDRFERVRPAQLKQHHAHRPAYLNCAFHFERCPPPLCPV